MKKLLFIILSVICVAVLFLIIYQVKTISGSQQTEISSNVSAEILSVYQDNCSRCHGKSGQGYAAKPVLQNNHYAAEEIKKIITFGLDEMPSFPAIKDPVLTELAEYVSSF